MALAPSARRRLGVATAVAALAAGCGSSEDPADLPPAAVPARSPAPQAAPAGRVVEVGARAEGVAVEPQAGVVAVAVDGPPRLRILDLRTLRVRRTVRLPGRARHVATAQTGGPFLVPIDGSRTVLEVDPRSGAITRTAVDRPAHDAAAAGALTVTGDGVAPIPDGPVARVRARERRLELLDPRTGAATRETAAGIGPAHVVGGDDGRTYVTDTDGGSVLLFRTEDELTLARRVALPGAPYGIALDREKGKLWVTLTATNEVVQLTADGQPREQRRYPSVRQPDAVAIDDATGRVFVTGRADGVLQAFAGYAQAP